MRGRVLAFLCALSTSAAFAVVNACSSFDDAAGSSTSPEGGTDADPSDAVVAADAPSADSGADAGADAPYCNVYVTQVRADFTGGRAVTGFYDVRTDGGSLAWNPDEGASANGSLEAITLSGDTQAQIEQDFPVGKTTRARLAFRTKLKSVADGGRSSIGCTMQLSTEKLDGDFGWIEIIFRYIDRIVLFDQDSHLGGSAINATAVANAEEGWMSFELELSEIRKSTAKYRARVGTKDVAIATADLPSPPDHFHIKCGIDSTQVAADTLTDDLVFEMCSE
jgi:hypothetical protein